MLRCWRPPPSCAGDGCMSCCRPRKPTAPGVDPQDPRTGQTGALSTKCKPCRACVISRGVHVRWARSSTGSHSGFLARDISERVEPERAARIRAAFSLPAARYSLHLRTGLPARRHHHLLEQGVGGSVRLLGTGSPGQSLLDLVIPAEMQAAVHESAGHVLRREPHPAGRTAPAAGTARPWTCSPATPASRCRARRPSFLYRHRHLRAGAAEEEARYLAFYDALTRLPNRRLLVDRLQQVMASNARTGRNAAVLFVDLDNFKTLNDSRRP